MVFLVLISFSISDTLTASNLKDFSFLILFLMSHILGGISYFLIAISIGPKIVLDSLSTLYEFSLISKVDTAFLKKVFSVSATLSSFSINSSFSMSFIWDLRFPLSEKNGCILVQKKFVIFKKDGLSLYKNSFLPFYKVCYSSFLSFVSI